MRFRTVGIESALHAKRGVEAAKEDFGSASARVVYAPARISAQQNPRRERGARVAMVERGTVGGTCVNCAGLERGRRRLCRRPGDRDVKTLSCCAS